MTKPTKKQKPQPKVVVERNKKQIETAMVRHSGETRTKSQRRKL